MTFEPRPPRRKILTAVLALLFVVGSIPLLLLGQRLATINREVLERQQQEYQLVVAEATAREISELVRAARARVTGFAAGLEASLLLTEPAQAIEVVERGGLLNRLVGQDDDLRKVILALRGASAEGFDFVTAERPSDLNLALAEERLLSTLLPQALSGLTLVETVGGELPLLVVVSPIWHGEVVRGVLSGLFSLDGLRSRLTARSEQFYLVYLVDRDGERLLARSREGTGDDLLESDLVAAFRSAGGTRTMSYRAAGSGGRQEMLGAYTTMAETGWGVFVEVDAERAYFVIGKMNQSTLRWSAVSMLIVFVLGTLFARRLVHPIRELADGALRLARGDFSRPIRLRSRSEIGLLADSFNHMTEEIRQKMAQLEAAARENKDLFMGTVRMLAEAIDEKDPYTRGHSERVTRYAVACARAMGLGPAETEVIQIGALLHDVGKIGIDDRILRKPTMLTDAEFAVMKQHPEKGAHILGALAQLADIVPGMRFHHEKVDGTGYPLGLAGDQIPLAAQVISVADTFDAMTTDRPYQRAMEPGFVVGKLRGWVGIRFRGDVVEAFARAYESGAIAIAMGSAGEATSVGAGERPLR